MRGGPPKSVAEVVEKKYGAMVGARFQPGDLISAVMNNGQEIRCNPKPWEGQTCPMCGGSEGVRVRGYHEFWWACTASDCIQRNAGRSIAPKPKIVPMETLLEQSGVPKLLQTATFDDWNHGKDILQGIMSWLVNPTGFCILAGAKGRGKTYIACCVVGHQKRFKGVQACFMDVVETKYQWLEEMRSDGLKKLPSKMTQCDLLVIDDIDKVNPSDSFYEFMYLVINSRHSSQKPTVITTNKSFDELEHHLGDAIASRLFKKESLLIEVQGQDLRQ